jgi:aminotransferase
MSRRRSRAGGRPEPRLYSQLPEQYFVKMLASVEAARSAGRRRIIDLGRGNPDLPPPARAVDAVRSCLALATAHGYPPLAGDPALRAAIAAHYMSEHRVELDPEREIAVVPGTKTAVMLAAMAAADRGDRILVPDPGYPDYLSAVALAHAKPAPLPLAEPDFRPDFRNVARAALLLLNYPSNPCAVCEPAGTFEATVEWAHANRVWVLHDLAYGFLAFDGRRNRSILEVDGARDVAVELWSASKIYGMAGWRIGFIVGNSDFVRRVQLLLDHFAAGVWLGFQKGLSAALTANQNDVEDRRRIYQARRDRLVAALPAARAPEGTFYAWLQLPAGVTAATILAETEVAVAPGSGFGSRGEGWVRLSLALDDDDLDEALDRLRPILE